MSEAAQNDGEWSILNLKVDVLGWVSDAVITTDMDFRVRSWNEAAEELFGYTEKEALGKETRELFQTSYFGKTKREELINELFETGSWTGTVIHRHKSGKELLNSVSVDLLWDDEEKPFGAIAIIREVKDQAKEVMAATRLAAIVESSDDAIVGKTLDGRITSWNKGAEELFGYTKGEMIGDYVFRLVPRSREQEEQEILMKLKRGESIAQLHTVRKHKRGRNVEVSLTSSPLRDGEGNVVGASMIVRDISEQVRVQQNLEFLAEASRLLYSSLEIDETLEKLGFLAVPRIADWCSIDRFVGVDEVEQVVVAHSNPEKVSWAKALREKSPPDLSVDRGLGKVMRTGELEFYPLITDEVLEASARDEEELALLRKIGFSAAMIVPLMVEEAVWGAITLVSSESKRVYSEFDLDMAKELASRASLAIENSMLYLREKQAKELRDVFISVASHELKTPITSMKVYAEVLQRRFEKQGDDRTVSSLRKINRQIDMLSGLVSELLDVSRIEKGTLSLEVEEFGVNELVEETVEFLQPTSLNHLIEIDGSVTRKVWGDRDRIAQVLINLLSNAVKYSPGEKQVVIHVRDVKNGVEICVEDFGEGISKEHQSRLFERFYRVNQSAGNTYPGLGIGLYISQEIMKLHGGRIEVDTDEGKGARFSIVLPYEREAIASVVG